MKPIQLAIFLGLTLAVLGCGGNQQIDSIPNNSIVNSSGLPPPLSTLGTPPPSLTNDKPTAPSKTITHVDHLSESTKEKLRAQGASEKVLRQLDSEIDATNKILQSEIGTKPQSFPDQKFFDARKDARYPKAYLTPDSPTRPGVFYVTMENASSGLPVPGHAAMVSRFSKYTIEAFGTGQSKDIGVKYHLNQWIGTTRHFLARTANATNPNLDLWASIYAEEHINFPYNWNFFRPDDIYSFYCSSLIWNAFKLYASTDIAGLGLTPNYVSPYQLYISSNAHTIYRQ